LPPHKPNGSESSRPKHHEHEITPVQRRRIAHHIVRKLITTSARMIMPIALAPAKCPGARGLRAMAADAPACRPIHNQRQSPPMNRSKRELEQRK